MAKIDTLFIIGNGFDLWQGLPTRYAEFAKYYAINRDRIVNDLRLKLYHSDNDGNSCVISDVELIYGDPFEPRELSDDFWNCFELSLAQIDSEKINFYFGKDKKGLKRLRKSVQNARKILECAFAEWLKSVKLDVIVHKGVFGDNCVFINFNYTDTLEQFFDVDPDNVFHIHGQLYDDDDPIVFGHNQHPQPAEESLKQFGGRFEGLFHIDELLYETDKHVDEHICELKLFFSLRGVMPDDIKRVYVLGHSMGLVDFEYFAYLLNNFRVYSGEETIEKLEDEKLIEKVLSDEDLQGRIQYITDTIGYSKEERDVEVICVEAMERLRELNRRAIENTYLFEIFGEEDLDSKLDYKSNRGDDAIWHVSCYGDKDEKWKREFFSQFDYTKFILHDGIDECLDDYVSSVLGKEHVEEEYN